MKRTMRARQAVLLAVVGSLLIAACGADVSVETGETGAIEAPTEAQATTEETPEEEMPEEETDDADPTTAPETSDDGGSDEVTIEAINGSAGVAGFTEDLPDNVTECAIQGLLDDTDLAIAVMKSDPDDLSTLPDGVFDKAVDLLLSCLDDDSFAEIISAGFAADGDDFPPEVGACFAAEFDTIDERRALVEIGLLEEGATPGPDVVQPVVDAVVACVPTDVWIRLVTAEMSQDAGFEDGLDQACLTELFDDDVFIADLMTLAFTGGLEGDGFSPEQAPLMRGIFECLDFGAIMAAEAAADGIELSQSTIDCVSTEFQSLGLVETFISGEEPSEEDLVSLIFGCFSSEELLQMGG